MLISLGFTATAAFVFYAFSERDYEFEEVSYRGNTSKFQSPFAVIIKFFGNLCSSLPLSKQRDQVRKKINAAGRLDGMTPDDFFGLHIIGVLLGYSTGSFVDGELDMPGVFSVCMTLFGLFYPSMWLKSKIAKRRRRMFRDLPDVLDTLRLAVEAGLDLSSAMKTVVEQGGKGPLIEELEEVEREMSLGRTRKDALKNFADRTGIMELNALVLSLIQADQLGASIGPVLKIQAEMSRTKRWQIAEALVNKMPLKMMAPLVILIFPASFIILFTPHIVQWIQSK